VKRGDTVLVQAIVSEAAIGVLDHTEVVEVKIKRVRGGSLWWRSDMFHPLSFKDDHLLRFEDRGVTWVPSWREEEASAFRVRCALVNT
jgi:hypothetical protein